MDNPKDTIGSRKVPMHHVPCNVLLELGLAMMEGSLKYGSHNYRAAGVKASVYYDAFQRHVMAWWEGENNDPDSGVSHLIKAMACLVVLRDSMHCDNWIDDRPMQVQMGLNMERFNELASNAIDKVDEPVKPFTEKKL
jgi:hypothetical protein